VPGARGVELSGHDYERPGKPDCAWDDPQATRALVSGLVGDALRVLAAAAEVEWDDEQAEAVALLALVAGQDVEPGERPGSWRIARKVARDRVISTVDPAARHARKTSAQRRDGYKAHLAVEPETGLVTACALTAANVPDGPTGVKLLAGEAPGLEVLGDSGYGSGQTRAALRAAGHRQTIKPIPLQSAVPGGFTLHDFRIDRQAGMVRCPAGCTAPISSSGQASFARWCQRCPLRRRCTTARRGRTIRLHRHEDELHAARRQAVTRSFQQRYRRWRPMVSDRSPGWSLTAAGGCPTAGSSVTTCGGRCGWPRSTCVGWWPLALLVRTRPGHWSDRSSSPFRSTEPARPLTSPCLANHRTTASTTSQSGSASFSSFLGPG
jgi:hypothetical protein